MTYFHPAPVERLLYKLKLFFPPVFQSKEINFLNSHERLHLIHINTKIQLDDGKKTMELFYSNVDTGYHFIESAFSKEKFINSFSDEYTKVKEIDLNQIKSFKKRQVETISFELDYDYCRKLFKKHKKRLKQVMKKEIKRI